MAPTLPLNRIHNSKKAMKMLEGLGRPEFRRTYHCDCKVDEGEEEECGDGFGGEFVPATAI